MFLRCSYFFGNLSLNVLINMVLTQKNQCTAGRGEPREHLSFEERMAAGFVPEEIQVFFLVFFREFVYRSVITLLRSDLSRIYYLVSLLSNYL